MKEITVKNRKPNIEKLLAFGFFRQDSDYVYSTGIVDEQMKMTVIVSQDGNVKTEVTDTGSNEEYVLHLVAGAEGAFVGQVRTEYEAVINEISDKCFEADVFKSEQAKTIIDYVRNTYGDELEFLWQKFPDNAIWRRKDNQKWYAALLTVSKRKLGFDPEFDTDEMIEIIDLRMLPEDIPTVVDGIKYHPGYHMNKKHWVTICLDGTVTMDEICHRIDESYVIAKK